MTEKITRDMLVNYINYYADIQDAKAELEYQNSLVKNAEEQRDGVKKQLHQLIWSELIARELIAEGEEMTGDPDRILYTDRETECKGGSPIGTCVELGWHDECIYCGSLRYSMVEYPEPPPKRIIKEGKR